ncbi:nuclease-related domain-containing protein [Brevibacillus centrosporus]|uniref:nuclease-related domain-containing protein n=1 Tax=Brevibacillus centrosporus TaxID=54910 RepID=UPI0039880DF4
MFSAFVKLFQRKKGDTPTESSKSPAKEQSRKAVRKGELGEYKINIQLDQMSKEYKHLHDLLIHNARGKSGYSQIDHVLLTPYAIFVIETKNYAGEIKGGRDDKQWSVNNKFQMLNPFHQNYGHIESLHNVIGTNKDDIVSLISFTRRCTFSVDPELRKIASHDLIVYDIELTEFINRKINYIKLTTNQIRFSSEDIEKMYSELQRANITDVNIRSMFMAD